MLGQLPGQRELLRESNIRLMSRNHTRHVQKRTGNIGRDDRSESVFLFLPEFDACSVLAALAIICWELTILARPKSQIWKVA